MRDKLVRRRSTKLTIRPSSDAHAQRSLSSVYSTIPYNSGNSLSNSLSSICYGNMTSLAAKYDICSPLPSTPDFEIKLHLMEVIRENRRELMHAPPVAA